ncbi:cytochrome P450 726A27-like [Euphorbia lathyris]|uniref:cytochrome P450 726A27-like n=1 Tax=Euphorbia lathyris TaxID=212925 RepID=UPI003313BD38
MELEIPSFPVLLSFFLFIFMVSKIWNKHYSTSSNLPPPPPGPWKLPLLGNIHHLLGHPPLHRLRDLAKTYGPVMSIQLGELSAVVISSPDTAKQVLKTQDPIFADRPISLATKILNYNGNDLVFGSYGDQWRQLKKICILELLNAKRVQSFKSVREEEVSNFISSLYSKSGSPVNLTHMLFAVSNSIMARISVGKNCENQQHLMRVLDGIFEASGGFSVADVFPSLKLVHLISGIKRKLQRLHQEMDEILEDIINEHRNRRIVQKSEADNLLDVLLHLQENGNLQVPLSNDNIKGTILDMFAAGTDTTSKTAEWAISELVQNPEVMKKAQEEVRRVFEEKGNVEEAGLEELKFLKCVIKETLRLHPALPLSARECREMSIVNGYTIYPKTKVLINIWAIGRDEKSWKEAEKFDPERFVDSSIDYKGSNPELVPFGAGKRMCPGILLGTSNLQLFLANLLYHFDWKIHGDHFDMTEAYAGSLKRKFDLNLIPIPFHSD